MKIIYNTILIAAAGFISLSANAQQKANNDSTLNRQILLERDYNPTLQDAAKINTLPAIYDPIIPQRNVLYIDRAPQMVLKTGLLGTVEPGEVSTEIVPDKKIGYLNLSGGMYKNLNGAFGINVVNTDTDLFDINANHISTNGNVDYIKNDKYQFDKAKAKYMNNNIGLKYKHTFEPSVFWFNGSFTNTSYNYYGNPFLPKETVTSPGFLDMSTKQNVNSFGGSIGLKSSDTNESLLKYYLSAGYDYFKSKYGPKTDYDGAKGGIFRAKVDLYTAFGSDRIIGIKGKILNQSISDPKFQLSGGTNPKDYFHSLTNIEATPYINFEGSAYNLHVGLNVGYVFDYKNSFAISPDVKLDFHFADRNTFYIHATGGVNENTFLDILQENRYVNPISRVGYSKTVYDAKIGVRSGIVQGFEFDIFGGYKHTQKDHLYTPLYQNTTNYSWGNVSNPLYANVSTGHLGAQIKTSLIPQVDLSAKAVGYFYDVKYKQGSIPSIENVIPSEKKAWGLPTFTAELNASIYVIDNLTLRLNYLYAGGRKTWFDATSVSMKDINELNAGGEYRIFDWMSAHVTVNNLLNQKYELIYGYTLQGINVMGGVNFKF